MLEKEILILFGAPGAGKGTQCKLLETALRTVAVSTGDLFRSEIKKGTPIGALLSKKMQAGDLIDDEITFDLLRSRVTEADCVNGFILDGYPRNVSQAEKLLFFIGSLGLRVRCVVCLDIEEAALVVRLLSRWVCANCNYTTSMGQPPMSPTAGQCPNCKVGPLVRRTDDNEEAIRNRFATYRTITEPVLKYLAGAGVNLFTVDADQGISDVHDSIMAVVVKSG